MNETFFKYVEEIKNDLNINELNIDQVARVLPTRRHYWGARLVEHKIALSNLKKSKDALVKQVADEFAKEAPVGLSPRNMTKAINDSDTLKKINQDIEEQGYIIELLEKAERNFFSATYDIKNICAIMQLERT